MVVLNNKNNNNRNKNKQKEQTKRANNHNQNNNNQKQTTTNNTTCQLAQVDKILVLRSLFSLLLLNVFTFGQIHTGNDKGVVSQTAQDFLFARRQIKFLFFFLYVAVKQ